MMDYPSLFIQNDSIQKVFLDKMSHKQASNVTHSKYKCDLCDYKTTKKELMRQHILTKHSEVKHRCPNCAFTHYYSGKVRSHFQEVHLKEKRRRDRPQDCFEIDCKNTQNEGSCEELGHNKLVCEQCDYRAFTKGTMANHIRNKHEGYLFSCNQCDFKNPRNDAVYAHIARIHDGVVYRCERCDLVMTSKGSLKSHNYFHHSDKTFQCDVCIYKCGNKSILNNHRRKVHTTNFQTEAEEKTHRAEKPNKCNQCDFAASQVGHLRTHLKTHSGEKSNKCDQCDYASSQAGHLRTHLKTHSGEKSYKCDQCDYASSRAGHLRTHLKTHSGEKSN